MTEFYLDDASARPPPAVPSVFLDSNVINELMTPLDLERAVRADMAANAKRVATVREVVLRQANARG